MRALVTGADGMLGTAVVPALRAAGFDAVGLTRAELDVTEPDAVDRCFEDVQPHAVIQCAAYTAVDAAETHENEAFQINSEGAGTVARACQRLGSWFVYPSTDYVFSGISERPYLPDDPVAPLNAYGRSKAAGEDAARAARHSIIVRTSWLYGAGGPNFVDTIRRLSRERERLEVVDDQVGRPTWTGTLANVFIRLLKGGASGTFHATDGGAPVTWFGLAKKICELTGSAPGIVPITAASLDRAATRPSYSVLDCSATEEVLGANLPDWETTLTAYLVGVT
jgi:dTDP-4-dehydrorhamnose reductase